MSLGPQFNGLMEKKQNILQQNADAETTRANATAQNVAQQQALQQQNNDAAMDRARLAANAQTQAANMNNDAMMDRASLAAQTQTGIAGMENRLGQDRLSQQGQQFSQTLGLDTAKAQEDSLLKRAELSRSEAGRPIVTDSVAGTTIDWIKHPGLSSSDIGKSPLDTVGGYNTPEWAKRRLGQL